MDVDHLGIAVKSLSASLPTWEATLATHGSPPEEVAGQRVRVSFLSAGGTQLELLEPTHPDSPVARFLTDRGEGIHHVAFAVPSVNAALAAVAEHGGRVVDRVARPGARGHLVGFAHPSAHHGVLVEFVERH